MVIRTFLMMTALSIIMGCQSPLPPIHTVAHVDLQRFMGSWFVIANIPTFIEKNAFNAVESYQLNEDGTVATTFTFREGSFTGPTKRYEPRGFVKDKTTNAAWDMQFFWPLRSNYRIVYLSEDYKETIIGREERDYVWIMAREPKIPDGELSRLIDIATREGYDAKQIQRVPQQW